MTRNEVFAYCAFLFLLLPEWILLRGVRFSLGVRWVGGEREGPYPRGVGYLWLARSSRWAARALFKSLLVVEVENKLSACELFLFLRKNGTIFLGGVPPAVAPEGNLRFRGKPSCPFIRLGAFT
jgi:hypothetical protein